MSEEKTAAGLKALAGLKVSVDEGVHVAMRVGVDVAVGSFLLSVQAQFPMK